MSSNVTGMFADLVALVFIDGSGRGVALDKNHTMKGPERAARVEVSPPCDDHSFRCDRTSLVNSSEPGEIALSVRIDMFIGRGPLFSVQRFRSYGYVQVRMTP